MNKLHKEIIQNVVNVLTSDCIAYLLRVTGHKATRISEDVGLMKLTKEELLMLDINQLRTAAAKFNVLGQALYPYIEELHKMEIESADTVGALLQISNVIVSALNDRKNLELEQ